MDLRIAFETGPADGDPVILLHGWPYDIHSFAEVAPILAAAGKRVILPHLRGYGGTRFHSASALRNGQQAALAVDVIALMQALAIDRAVIGGFGRPYRQYRCRDVAGAMQGAGLGQRLPLSIPASASRLLPPMAPPPTN